jgi:hypothetical protein
LTHTIRPSSGNPFNKADLLSGSRTLHGRQGSLNVTANKMCGVLHLNKQSGVEFRSAYNIRDISNLPLLSSGFPATPGPRPLSATPTTLGTYVLAGQFQPKGATHPLYARTFEPSPRFTQQCRLGAGVSWLGTRPEQERVATLSRYEVDSTEPLIGARATMPLTLALAIAGEYAEG